MLDEDGYTKVKLHNATEFMIMLACWAIILMSYESVLFLSTLNKWLK